jgi:membrane associated rhomboid family serine protease
MDDPSGTGPDPGPTPETTPGPPHIEGSSPGSGPTPAGDGTGGGLQMEACYRHPTQLTGVHCTRCGKPICVDCMRPAAVGYQCPDCLASERSSGYKYQRGVRSGLAATPATRAILIVTVAVFVIELVTGACQLLGLGGNEYKLVRLGAAFPPLTAGLGHLLSNGNVVGPSTVPQLWRLVTPMFLHLGLIHIGFNMYALAILGPAIERAYGRWRFVAIYFVAGIAGNVASFVFGNVAAVGAGASTAVFGLFGVWLVYTYRRRDRGAFYQANFRAMLITLALNFFLNIGLAGVIDWRGHLGGFIGGVALGFTVEGIGEGSTKNATKILGFVAVLAICAVLVFVRIHQLRNLFGVA